MNQPEEPPFSKGIFTRVTRVVSYLFIGSALIVVTVAGDPLRQPLLYVVLAMGALMIVVGQDLLPMALLGRWRPAVEAGAVLGFLTLLIFPFVAMTMRKPAPVKIVALFGGKGFMQTVVREDSGVEKPADLKDEDYKAFYRELYPMQFEEPLFHIHLNVDYPFNLTGQPAATVPCGFARGDRPVGIQIVGGMYRDDVVLRAAHAYQQTQDPRPRHPEL